MTNEESCMRVAVGFISGIAIAEEVLGGVEKLETRKAKELEMASLSDNLKLNIQSFTENSKMYCDVDALAEGDWGRAVLRAENAINFMSEGNPEEARKELREALYSTIGVSY